ncbi:MAG: SIMPL domain-containing protein [Parcubacteria group bacterium]|nr:SIMPL domain-containing protein [Parcubacteria group bacterium]MCR4342336.1 SIMPL domain-containing protein [Patescibacteria group bacterium]
MNQEDRIKKYLKITGIFIMLVLSYTALSLASSYSRSIDPASLRSFSVSGEGKVTAIPDIAQFTFSIITEGGVDIAELQKENTSKSNKAIDFIKANGVENKDIKTQSYNIEPRYQYYNCGIRPLYSTGIDTIYPAQEPCPPSEIVGYTIRQTISVKLRDFSKTGEVLSGVVKNGANDVSSLTFTIDNQKEIEKEARDAAIKEAREKAKEIAKSAKFRVGDIISINEGYSTPFIRYGISGASITETKDASAPQIEPGSQEIIVNVTIQYEIK